MDGSATLTIVGQPTARHLSRRRLRSSDHRSLCAHAAKSNKRIEPFARSRACVSTKADKIARKLLKRGRAASKRSFPLFAVQQSPKAPRARNAKAWAKAQVGCH